MAPVASARLGLHDTQGRIRASGRAEVYRQPQEAAFKALPEGAATESRLVAPQPRESRPHGHQLRLELVVTPFKEIVMTRTVVAVLAIAVFLPLAAQAGQWTAEQQEVWEFEKACWEANDLEVTISQPS